MATESTAKSVHNTLAGTTADKITITGFRFVDVINRDAANPLYVSCDGTSSPTTAVAAANGTEYVAPSGFVRVDTGSDHGAVSIVGNGNDYSVIGVSA